MIRSQLICVWFCLLTGCLTGCLGSGRIYPPKTPEHPVTVYLTDYGRHSTLLLPVSASRLVEYEWGDWKWMAYNHRSMPNMPRAMLFSDGSAFSRRFVDPGFMTPQGVKSALDNQASVIALQVDRPAADQLRHDLDDRFLRNAHLVIYNHIDSCCMARDPAHYWLFYNCNHLTADWLRQLGCRVEGDTTLSGFRIAQENDDRSL